MNRLVVWGGVHGLESHRHIHRAFYNTARKIGTPTVWVDNQQENVGVVEAGDTVISADIYGDWLPYVPHVNYVLHNFNADHPVYRLAEPHRILRLQVWTYDSYGEQWDDCRAYDRDGQILFQPWGTDLLAEEFLDPVFNPHSVEAAFVGAIWSEITPGGDLGNSSAIRELREALGPYGLRLRHLTHITDDANIMAVRAARIAPAVAGGWQVDHGYLPCRVFKNASYGCLSFTNVPEAQRLFGGTMLKGDTIQELVAAALRLNGNTYLDMVWEQQRIAARYTYRHSLEAIDRAFNEQSPDP